jgi:hypothetical protein
MKSGSSMWTAFPKKGSRQASVMAERIESANTARGSRHFIGVRLMIETFSGEKLVCRSFDASGRNFRAN